MGTFIVGTNNMITHNDLIKEIRTYLLNTLTDALPTQVIQDTQNYASLPHNAVVIAFLFDFEHDTTVTTYDPENDKAAAQNSVEARVQITFYGDLAESRSRRIALLWRSYYTTDRLALCKPLYVQSRERHPYINDSKQYENRYILDLALQYNPQAVYDQDFSDTADINIIPVPEG